MTLPLRCCRESVAMDLHPVNRIRLVMLLFGVGCWVNLKPTPEALGKLHLAAEHYVQQTNLYIRVSYAFAWVVRPVVALGLCLFRKGLLLGHQMGQLPVATIRRKNTKQINFPAL
jgi:hypothetical protein